MTWTDSMWPAFLNALPPGHRVAIHPGSGGYSMARRWEPVKWAAVADSLVERYGAQVILVGTPADGADSVQAAMHESSNQPVRTDLATSACRPAWAVRPVPGSRLRGDAPRFGHGCTGGRAVWPVQPSGLGTMDSRRPFDRRASGPALFALQLRWPQGWLRDGCWHRSCMADLQPAQVLAAVETMDVLV